MPHNIALILIVFKSCSFKRTTPGLTASIIYDILRSVNAAQNLYDQAAVANSEEKSSLLADYRPGISAPLPSSHRGRRAHKEESHRSRKAARCIPSSLKVLDSMLRGINAA